jgi:sugar lactone lactonase YvrE
MNPHNKQNRLLSMVNKRYSRAAGLVVLAALAGCAITGPRQASGPVFYPPLPNPPRIQYLASFSEARDVTAPPGAFAQFVLGSKTDEADIVKKPYGVAVNRGRIYVVDTRGPAYAVFDLTTQKYQLVTGSAGGRLRKPINITIDQDGFKYITDTDRNQVVVFDKDDRYARAYGVEEQFKPSDVAVVGNRLFVADLKHHQVHVLDKASGKTLSKFGKPGSAEGEFFHPTNLTVSADNFLYITDTSNYRIQKFTLDGQFVRAYGGIGSGPGQFARPKGVAVDRDGRMYIVDAAFENIQVMDPKGKLLLFFGEPGERRENINLPTAITIDYDSVPYFQKYADPKFKLEYVIAVASQFGNSKVNVYGFGKMEGMDYSVTDPPPTPKEEAR